MSLAHSVALFCRESGTMGSLFVAFDVTKTLQHQDKVKVTVNVTDVVIQSVHKVKMRVCKLIELGLMTTISD